MVVEGSCVDDDELLGSTPLEEIDGELLFIRGEKEEDATEDLDARLTA